MLIETTPTTLKAYYCHHCHGIIATTELSLINPEKATHCPICEQETLLLVTNKGYGGLSETLLFPPSQQLLLDTFFKYSDNTSKLLNAFKVLTAVEIFTFQLDSLQAFKYVHIYISPELEITFEAKDLSDFSIEIIATEPNLDLLSDNAD